MDFDSFVSDIKTNGWNVFGTEVYQDGRLFHSWGDTTGIHEIYSATKSVLSVGVGIIYDMGLIDLQRCFLDYLPSDRVAKISSARKAAFEKITVERLLTMSVKSLPFRAEGDDWLDFALCCDIEDADERTFNYSNICSFLTGVCLTHIIGSDLGKFIEEKIFAPLDITDFEYGRSPEGYFYGASAMKLSVHDLSKFGLLMSSGGIYNGKRIISEEYARLATGIRQMNREGGYGYYFWKYRDGFSINGKWKQKCYCLPERGLIVTYLSHIEDDSHDLLESMEKYILGIGADNA